MKMEKELLVRTMTPERAAKVLKMHEVADGLISKHELGRVFIERIWPLLKEYIESDSFSKEAVLDVCNLELSHLRDSALLFCEKAFHTTLQKANEEDEAKRENEVAWRFRELAMFLNDKTVDIDTKLLDWAYFSWNTEFYFTLNIEELDIGQLIEEIDAEKIKETRHNKEFYGYGGDYLDVPDWLAYLTMYLECEGKYESINLIMEKMRYLPLQDALAHRLLLANTFVESIMIHNSVPQDYGVMMFKHWYQEIVKEGGTLRGYRNLDEKHPLFKEGNKLFEDRGNTIASTIKATMALFFERVGRNEVEKWYYGTSHFRGGMSNTDADESEAEIRQIIETYMEDTFKITDAMANFENAKYLVFLGNQCEKIKADELLNVLEKAYYNYLNSFQLYKLPAFGDELMEVFRGFTLSMRVRKTYSSEYKKLLVQYLTRHEGLGSRIDDDYNDKVAREVFVMSALMLMTEDEDLLVSDRKKIFNEVLDLLFLQINSCWMEHLQERYVDALKMAYVMFCQVWVKKRESFEIRLSQSVHNLFWVASVIVVGDGTLSNKAAQTIVNRWNKEHLVMYVRAQQTHRMKQYEWLKAWVTGISIMD